MPTRDAVHYLRTCITSLLEKTSWPDYELLVVDNQSSDPAALEFLSAIESDSRVRVLHYDRSFNFSAVNNFAVEHACGEVICMLNNDTEVITADWLEEMVFQLLQPQVGAVGARVYFSDGRLQHGGDRLGPSHQILVKTHPGAVAGRKGGHFSAQIAEPSGQVMLIAENVHAPALLEHADAVFCVTSQVGLEALLWGKPMHVFGMPFYAGWGLTHNALGAPGRVGRLASSNWFTRRSSRIRDI